LFPSRKSASLVTSLCVPGRRGSLPAQPCAKLGPPLALAILGGSRLCFFARCLATTFFRPLRFSLLLELALRLLR
jgi:hypothetical protein